MAKDTVEQYINFIDVNNGSERPMWDEALAEELCELHEWNNDYDGGFYYEPVYYEGLTILEPEEIVIDGFGSVSAMELFNHE